jgi:hypothetical protein
VAEDSRQLGSWDFFDGLLGKPLVGTPGSGLEACGRLFSAERLPQPGNIEEAVEPRNHLAPESKSSIPVLTYPHVHAIITFTSDFGSHEPYVRAVRGSPVFLSNRQSSTSVDVSATTCSKPPLCCQTLTLSILRGRSTW